MKPRHDMIERWSDRLFIVFAYFVAACFFLVLGMEWGRRIERGKTVGMKKEITTGSLEQHKDAKKRAKMIEGCLWFDEEKERWIVEKRENC